MNTYENVESFEDVDQADQDTALVDEPATASILKHYLTKTEGKQVVRFQEGSTVVGYASQKGRPRLYTIGDPARAGLDNTVEYPVWMVKTGKPVALPEGAKYLGVVKWDGVIYTVFGA